jgi:hypothetical protein
MTMMDDRYYLEREFELRFLKSRGAAFQDFFSELMERAYPSDFQRVRPHGNTGDYKCDGYLPSERTVFQVYGPEDIRNLKRLLRKISTDFTGALQHWAGKIDRWIFVHNCQSGLPAQAIQLLDDLGKKPYSPVVRTWGYEELRGLLNQISPQSLCTLFPAAKIGEVHPPVGALPLASTIERYWEPYWTWIRNGLHVPTSSPYIISSNGLDLPVRLIPPNHLRDIVPLEEPAVTQNLANTTTWREASDDGSFTGKSREGVTEISDALRTRRQILIVGDSGSGKSTLLRRFAKLTARRLHRRGLSKENRQTPVIVELWRFSPERSLLDLCVSSITRSGMQITREELLLAVEQGYVGLLLDGLDEVTSEYRRECLAQIVNLAERYPHMSIVLTSRPFPAPPAQFHSLHVAPLEDIDIASALLAQFGSKGAFSKRFGGYQPVDYVRLRMLPEVRQMCRRPLTLALAIKLLEKDGELPQTLFGAYDRFLSLLLDWEVHNSRLFSATAAATVLEEAAYVMASQHLTSLSSVDLVREASKVIAEQHAILPIRRVSIEEIFHNILSTGLLSDIGGEIYFSHKTFMEFLAARRILRQPEQVHSEPISMQLGVARFLCSGMSGKDISELLEQHLTRCDDVESLMPLLKEASEARCVGGRFEALYRAIALGQDMAVDLTHFLRRPEDESFIERIDELVETCLEFKPKALSVLKNAADGILRGSLWESSRLWFERVNAALEVYDWPGAALHRQFVETGFFEAEGPFYSYDSDQKAGEWEQVFFEYVDNVYTDDFAKASESLIKVNQMLRDLRSRVGESRQDDPRTIQGKDLEQFYLYEDTEDALSFLRQNPYGLLYGDDDEGYYEFIWEANPKDLFNKACDLLLSLQSNDEGNDENLELDDQTKVTVNNALRAFQVSGLTEDALSELMLLCRNERAGIPWWGDFEQLKSADALWPQQVRQSFRNDSCDLPINAEEELEFAKHVTRYPFTW